MNRCGPVAALAILLIGWWSSRLAAQDGYFDVPLPIVITQAEADRAAESAANDRASNDGAGIDGAGTDVAGTDEDEEDTLSKLAKRIQDLESDKKKRDEADKAKKEKEKQQPTFKMGGQLVIDSLWFSQSPASRAAIGDVQDAFDFRRARLYAQGEYESFNYATGFDFAQGTPTNGRPTFLDNYVGVTDLPLVQNLRVGHFFEPFSLERSSSNRWSTFLERSLPDAFAPARNLGAMLFGTSQDESLYWAVGTFRGDTDNFGDDAGDQTGQTVDTRLVFRPYYDEASNGRYYMHLGGAYSFRDAADGEARYRSRPEAFGNSDSNNATTPYFVDTGTLAATSSQLFGQEFLWVHGPLSLQSEYVFAPVNQTAGPVANFQGGYVTTSFFLTGEHRPYNRATATTDRVRPNHNFSPLAIGDRCNPGIGAWEIAARLSFIDLDDANVRGGVLRDTTFGTNWYLSPYHRIKMNYIVADLHRDLLHTHTHIFGLRFDTDF